MKISCDSCGAKYTIADAKVQGRKVKVRCKSCKATILVDGNAGGDGAAEEVGASDPPPAAAYAAAPAAGAAMGTPKPGAVKKDAWSVNLSDDDSRDMTTAEIIAGWKSGLVTQDAYAWKDGMSDWKPILEIPELKQKLLAAKPLHPDPVVSSAKLPPKPGSAASDDLFGGVDVAGSEADIAAGPARPSPKAAAGTGARNESSVLFSLDSLTGGGAPTAPTMGGADIFGGLGGGGLLANTDLLTAPAKEPPPAPTYKQASIRPVASGEKKSSMPIVLAILGAAVVIGGALFFVMGGKDEPAAVDPAAASMAAELEKTKAALEQSKADEEAAKKKAEEVAKAAEAEAAKAKAAEEAGKKPAGDKPADASATAATTPSTGTPSTGTPSTSPGTTTPKPAAPSGGGAFDVGAAKAALAGAAASAAGCGTAGGPKGSGRVQVTFAPSGRVTSANVVAGPFGGTSVGGCVASKFRAARVPAFSGAPQTVAKSFTVN